MNKKITKLMAALALLLFMTPAMVGWGQTYSLTPNNSNTGLSNTAYITTLTEFTYNGVSWKMNQWNPSTLQIKTNQGTAANEFRFYNSSAIPGKITQVVIKFSALTVSNANGFMFVGGTSEVSETTGGTAGTWNSSAKTITWTPNASDNFTYFAFYQNGKVASGTNYLASSDAIVVTYEASGGNTPSMSVSPNSIDFGSNEINPTTPYTETFEVTFANLTENLTVTGFTGVSVSPATINYNATSPQTVTVSYNPTAAGSISGNISVNSSEVTEALVAVTGSAYDPANVDTYERYTGALVEGDYIICANAEVAMKNVISSSRFENQAVTVSDNKITNPDASIIWHIAPDGDYYTMYNAAVGKYAAGTTSNNQGTLIDAVTDYARWDITYQYSNYTVICYGRNSSTNKYLRRNGDYGWATYANNTGNVPTFYKKVVTNQVAKPSFSIAEGTYYETQSITLSCATDGATIYYTTDGTTPSTSNGMEYTTVISVSTTTTIKAIAVKSGMADSDVATATYTIEQPYSTIPALFAAATAVEQDVRVTFGNWVVSGVSTNGKNVYVTDNTGNGFIIYFTSDMSGTFSAGKILSGTAVACKLKLYNGAAELVNLNASDLTITDGGTVSIVNIAMASLSGVNTGALIHYDNLTCNLNNNKYYLSDGTTTLQAYNTLYAFSEFEDGKTYNVTGVYVQYNNTKEIAPRSTADIEEVTVQPEEYTLTINNPQNVTITATYDGGGVEDEVLSNGDNADVLNGTVITLAITPASGYVLSNYSVLDGSGQPVTLTPVPNTTDMWTFIMPASNVTVSATVVEASAVTTYSLASTIESGKQYIIVGWADSKAYAMGYQKSNNRHAVEISVNGNTATATIADTETNAHEFTITSLGSGFYSIEDATNLGGYLYAAGSNANQLKTESTLSDNSRWEITVDSETGLASVSATNSENRHVMRFNNGDKLFACYATESSQHPVYLYVKDETPTPAPITLDINAWTTDQNGVPGNWYLITSPLHDTINPVNVGNMIPENLSNVDLYRFDQNPANGLEWINYKNQDGSGVNTNFGDLMPGTGYLYANAETIQLQFTGTPYSGDGVIPLSYSTENQDATMHGWNLVGNPFTVGATIDRDFYWMNPDGRKDIIVAIDENNLNPTVAPMEGIFVHATGANQSVTFTPSETKVTRVVERTVIELTQNNNVIDRAIIRYGSGSPMPKIQLNENNTKIYFMMENGSYAVVVGDYQAELPLNFKAATAGSYTLSFNNQNAEFSYLHLIDNQTNTETDLLVNPNYTFSAQTTDNAARFIVVYERAYFGKGITGYGEGDGHYYLLASPIGEVDPDRVGDMFKFEHDLYYFDQDQELEWINIKDGNTNLMPGKGYLYASKQDVTLKFYGSAYNGEGDVTLVKNATNNPEGGFEGWNLVGNPFAQTAYLDRDFYVMRDDGAEIILSERDSIGAMEGIFVNAVNDGESMTFSTSRVQDKGQVVLNVTKGRGITVDRALVRFGEGRQMPKIQLFKNSTKVYIPVDGQDYAVVRGEEMGEMPVSFKAESNDTYTMNLSSENVEFAYLHLIDNMTGADIDLLQNPSYSFEAKATDYSQRFKLVFATGAADGSEAFAFFSNGSFVVNNNGNATLQVIDVTGRIIKCESINGCACVNVNAAPGVYMLRLVNGDNVKVQKVVVR